MSRALTLARRGRYTAPPNPCVGCVIVREQQVVGEGWHARSGEPHAEIQALRMAGEQARGAAAYVTLEPCCHQGRTGPCTSALREAGIARVIAAMQDPNPRVAGGGIAALREAGVAVEIGLLENEAYALNPGFVSRMSRGRPYVRCKLAMSVDGRTAMASGESKWITGPAARRDVHRMRRRSCAILTGIGTLLADDPRLDVRLEDAAPATPGEARATPPMRVVADSRLRTPPESRLLALPGRTLIATAVRDAPAIRRLEGAGAEVVSYPGEDGRVALDALMRHLGGEEINEVLVECGPTLAGALLSASLIDDLIIYVAPVLMGDAARGLFQLPGVASMADLVKLEIADIRQVGHDWRILARPQARTG